MNYITLLNSYERWSVHNTVPSTAELMWYKLVGVWNKTRWKEWFQIDNKRLMKLLKTGSEHTLIKARNALVQAGLLEYVSGSRGNPGSYHMLTDALLQRKRAQPREAEKTQVLERLDSDAWFDMERRLLTEAAEEENCFDDQNNCAGGETECAISALAEDQGGRIQTYQTTAEERGGRGQTYQTAAEEWGGRGQTYQTAAEERGGRDQTYQTAAEERGGRSQTYQSSGVKDSGMTISKYKKSGETGCTAKSADISKHINYKEINYRYRELNNKGIKGGFTLYSLFINIKGKISTLDRRKRSEKREKEKKQLTERLPGPKTAEFWKVAGAGGMANEGGTGYEEENGFKTGFGGNAGDNAGGGAGIRGGFFGRLLGRGGGNR